MALLGVKGLTEETILAVYKAAVPTDTKKLQDNICTISKYGLFPGRGIVGCNKKAVVYLPGLKLRMETYCFSLTACLFPLL